jgi:hypothetical protein
MARAGYVARVGDVRRFPNPGMLALAVWLLRTPLRWFAESLIIGFAGGLGARIAGTFNSPERAERDRERWEDRRRR